MKKFSALLMMIVGLLSRTDGQRRCSNDEFEYRDRFSTPPTSSDLNFGVAQFGTNHTANIIVKGIKQFALDMDRAIYRSEGDTKSNVIFSPLNLVGTLAMVLLGSAGVTFDEISKILGLKSDVDISAQSELVHQIFGVLLESIESKTNSGPEISVANGLFIQNGYPIRPEVQAAGFSYYKNKAIDLDFMDAPTEATKFIDNWVNTKTQGKIPSILNEEVDTNTKLMIASALYFSGEWNNYFIMEQTRREKFMVTPNEPVMVDMMYTTGEYPFYQDNRLGVKITGLPYKGYQPTSGHQGYPPKYQAMMYILLPTSKDAGALNDLQSRLTVDNIEDMISKMINRTCILGVPRMKLSSTLKLKEALKSLGLSSLFDSKTSNLGVLSAISSPSRRLTCRLSNDDGDGNKDGTDGLMNRFIESNRDFTKFHLDALRNDPNLGNPGLFASNVLHKVEIDITETGTVAAAATISTVAEKSGSTPVIRGNQPFLFFIRHELSGLPLFWSTVNKPTPNY